MPKKASPKPTKPTTKKPAIQRNSKKNRSNNSSEDDAADKKKPAIQRNSKKNRGDLSEDDAADKTMGHLSKEDYLVIIKWLKIERNYDSFFGTGKADAMMYDNLCNQSPSKINLMSDEGLIQYLQRQVQENQKAGIYKIDDKLQSMCPHYHAINKLMGVRAFINPCFKVDAQDENKTATSSPSEPAANKIRSSGKETMIMMYFDQFSI
ncbi:hypothetical protein VP01_30g6 [Puccinia sorghi]|uniref:Uncharacterized protein n=1 Tax=Puccinia sorghi TaxID=27349 RepID=A0A0L6UZF7_9BASI|nr:hypothetical protein VP01_30g6 [Puccinia sorghi]